MIMKTSATLLLSLCCLLASCAGGRARSLHVEGDLCDIDLDYLKTSAKPTHTSGADEFEQEDDDDWDDDDDFGDSQSPAPAAADETVPAEDDPEPGA